MNEKLTQPWHLPMHAKIHVFACPQKNRLSSVFLPAQESAIKISHQANF